MGAGRMGALRSAVVGGVLFALVGCHGSGEPGAVPRHAAPDIHARAVDGKDFHLREQRGQVVVLTFGYTSCPDVCPLTLARLKGLFAKLGPQAAGVQAVFISVDPERDTAERLNAYLTAFDKRFRGLSLAPEQLQPVLSAFEVKATRRIADSRRYRNVSLDSKVPYSIDHTAGFFVVDKQGQLALRFAHETPIEQMVPGVLRLLAQEG